MHHRFVASSKAQLQRTSALHSALLQPFLWITALLDCTPLVIARRDKMHFLGQHGLAVLGASLIVEQVALGAPVFDQQPIQNGRVAGLRGDSPYTRKYRDPYDHKVDTVGDGMQPLPIVSLAFISHIQRKQIKNNSTSSMSHRHIGSIGYWLCV